jgi:hypothetical protein
MRTYLKIVRKKAHIKRHCAQENQHFTDQSEDVVNSNVVDVIVRSLADIEAAPKK